MNTWAWKDDLMLREYMPVSDATDYWRSQATEALAALKRERARANRYRRLHLMAVDLAVVCLIAAIIMAVLWQTK